MTFVAIVAFTVLLILPSTPVFAAKCSASANPGVNWSDCRKRNIILTRSDLSGATLQGTDFSATDLSRSQMGGSDLTKATIVRASFAGTYADNAVFERSVGSRTNFQEASLKSATFYKAEMPRANFTGAALNDVNFDHSDLGRADFTDADITGTRFEFSILARADLRGSRFEGPIDFTGAYFFLTRIEGVDLSAAEGLAQWQIDMACGDDDTKLPDGVSRPGSWPCSMDW
ncbi:MAG: pentapeptide repeat-containing protein [Pseudomonadota bacterium]